MIVKIRKINQARNQVGIILFLLHFFLLLCLERSFAWNPRFSIVRLRIELRDTISGIFTRVRIHEEEEEGEGWKSLLSAVQGIHCFRYKRGQRVETARRGVHCSASGSRERHRLSKIPPSPSHSPERSGSNFGGRNTSTCLLASNFRENKRIN